MTSTTTILVDVDPTADRHPAVVKAIWLAKHYDAALELFICDYDPYLTGEKAREYVLRERRDKLATLAAEVESANVEVSTDVVWDHPIDAAVIRKTIETKPMMVVKDTHYHPVLKRTIFSNTDWGLIRNCPADLLLVKATAVSESPRVLAAVDPLHEYDKPADLDRRILSVAQQLAQRTQGELAVFHSFDPTPAIAGASITVATPIAVPVAQVTAALEERHREALIELTDQFSIPADRVHMHQGVPRELLPAITIQQHTDILVMGAVSRRGLKNIFIGHTAERVLDRLPCDLLIVKPTDFAKRTLSDTVEPA
jgi:universal stress protein E